MGPLDLDPGKYAAYVWPSFAVTAAVLAWLTADTLARARRWRREAERLERERAGSEAP
jgi:heme exporter protein D